MSGIPNDIKSLCVNLSQGEETAFRSLFDHYKASFYATAFKMTRSAELAEEVVQEVFITIWNKRNLVGAARNPEAYLLKILHNHIYSQFRKLVQQRQLKKNLADQQADTEENPVEELLLAKENRKLLDAVISKLPAQQQLVYRLSKQESMSREEIAEKLKISPNTVKNHLASAIEFIREYLKKGASMVIWATIINSL